MGQIFPRQFGLLFGLALVAAAVLLAGAVVGWRVAIAPALGEPVEQPVPFSHKHHVGDDGLDCRYCHATADSSAYAGMPSSSTCMNCHSQLFTDAPLLEPVRASWRNGTPLHWNRIYRLPDFAFFDHSIHVRAGVGCEHCHGDLSKMPLTWQASSLDMQWCLACHREARRILASAHAGAAHPVRVRSARELSDCSTCHR